MGRVVLPAFADRGVGETSFQFGARALQFLIATDGCTAALSDEALEQADHASIWATTGGREMSVLALKRISRTKHLIRSTLKFRAADRAEEEAAKAAAAAPKPTLIGGTKVPRVPFTPVLPPTGAGALL